MVKSKLFCFFGFHKWKVIRQEEIHELRAKIISDLERLNYYKIDFIIGNELQFLSKKVCLICKKESDEITPFVDFVKSNYVVTGGGKI